MLLPQVAPAPTVVTNLTGQTQKMGLAMNGKAFAILSSGLYKWKHLAIVRELSTNAWDAHQDAKTQHKRFDLQLPTALNPKFRIRDYGTGMDEDTVFNTYNCLFASTKTQTNEAVGCLGLGSKTPFAYTSAVTVTSYQNKVASVYNSTMDGDGIPCMRKVTDYPTDEENGLEIQFAVDPKDCHEFKTAAESVFMTFLEGAKPNFLNTSLDADELSGRLIKVCDNLFFCENRGPYHSSVNCIQGNVCYPLSHHLLPQTYRETLGRIDISKYAAYIKVPIGTVDFQPSRETLDEKAGNYARIEPYLGGVHEHFLRVFRDNYKDIKTEYDRAAYQGKRLSGECKDLYSDYYFNLIMKEKGLKESSSYKHHSDALCDCHADLEVEIVGGKGRIDGVRGAAFKFYWETLLQKAQGPPQLIPPAPPVTQGGYGMYGPPKPTLVYPQDVPFKHIFIPNVHTAERDCKIVLVDTEDKFRSRITHRFSNSGQCRIVLRQSAKYPALAAKFCAQFPGIEVIKVSDLPHAPVKARSPGTKRVMCRWFQKLVRYTFLAQNELETLDNLGIDETKPFYYIVGEAWNCFQNINVNSLGANKVQNFVDAMHKDKLLETNQVVIVRNNHVSKVPNHLPNAHDLYVTLQKQITAKYTQADMEKLRSTSAMANQNYSKLDNIFSGMGKSAIKALEFGEEYLEVKDVGEQNLYDLLCTVMNVEVMYPGTASVEGARPKLWKAIAEKYPLITCFSGSYYNHQNYSNNVIKLLKKDNQS